jgi:GntR family transcriptional regulator, transcriptional repressor for pyruvate dehydrogenase complex
MAQTQASDIPFRKIEQVRAHEYVADQLRRQIMLHMVPAGHALLPERELARVFRVGRETVQRAIRLLVEDGLVEKRRGRSGGTFVLDVAGDPQWADAVFARLRANRHETLEALAYRLEMEPAAVAEACRRRTQRNVEAIRRASRRLAAATTEPQMMRHDTEFHLAVARASRNRYFIEGIERVRVVLNDAILVLPGSPLWLERTQREHAAIAAAIEAADPRAGRRAARVHVSHTDRSIHALLDSL